MQANIKDIQAKVQARYDTLKAKIPPRVTAFFERKPDDKDSDPSKPKKKFPWLAAGGLLGVTIVALIAIALTLTAFIKVTWILIWVLSIPFKLSYYLLYVAFLPLKLILYLFYGSSVRTVTVPAPVVQAVVGPVHGYSPAIQPPINCNNTLEFQGWEVLNFFPGRNGDPKPVKYSLNSPTPHALSIVDIDYRDTRLDVFADGDYIGSTSDFPLDKSVYCGEDLNACIKQGFSAGTILIPGGKKSVEINWSGKDVFPGTDRIVWGSERKRRVMWKKELCV